MPGWRGSDYAELVRDEKELDVWIRDGSILRLKEIAAARFFIRRQALRMPAYGKALNDEEISALKTYVTWIRRQHS